jgi:hypothetical protein
MMGRVFFFFPWERALPAATANESVSPSIAGRIALPTFRCGLTMPKSSPGQAWWPHQDSRFVKTPSYEMENKKFDRICPE